MAADYAGQEPETALFRAGLRHLFWRFLPDFTYPLHDKRVQSAGAQITIMHLSESKMLRMLSRKNIAVSGLLKSVSLKQSSRQESNS
jgi:hypothetical protein